MDPAKSAEPPINSGIPLVNNVRISSEDFLVAIGLSFYAAFFFALVIIELNFFR